MNKIIHGDSLVELKKLPDKSVDILITDPPYGIKEHGGKRRFGPQSVSRGFKSYIDYTNRGWDAAPISAAHFEEMFRVSKHQLIFGMNYYTPLLPPTKCFVTWHKKGTDKSDFADCELIWTSFDRAARYFKYDWVGFGYINNPDKERKQHPTQKPQALMRWLVEQFSKPGDLILDPFAGSGSTCVAAKALGRRYIGIEREVEYVKIARARLKAEPKPFLVAAE